MNTFIPLLLKVCTILNSSSKERFFFFAIKNEVSEILTEFFEEFSCHHSRRQNFIADGSELWIPGANHPSLFLYLTNVEHNNYNLNNYSNHFIEYCCKIMSTNMSVYRHDYICLGASSLEWEHVCALMKRCRYNLLIDYSLK